MGSSETQNLKKPEIYRYHDYQEFLKDWLAFLKASQSGFSLRSLARESGLASGYLPMILAGTRKLSTKALAKLAPLLSLSKSERSYLEILVALGTSDSQAVRMDALERMKKFRAYQRVNPKETEVYQYLTRWYYVAIREMATIPGFRTDPLWIQKRLRNTVTLKEIKDALEFLITNKYLELQPDGSIRPPEKDLDCIGGVYRVALTEFHREMFALGARSIENTPSEERRIMGHTFGFAAKDFEKAKAVIDNAIAQLQELGKKHDGDTIYHAELALFPLTRPESGSEPENATDKKEGSSKNQRSSK